MFGFFHPFFPTNLIRINDDDLGSLPSFQRQPSHHDASDFQHPRSQFQNTKKDWQRTQQKPKQQQQTEEPVIYGSGRHFKVLGNQAFQQQDYDKAIEMYNQAIEKDQSQSIYFHNRGRCYKIQKKYNEAFADAVVAAELDDKNIKAHLLLGQLLCIIGRQQSNAGKIQNGIQKLTKALTLCSFIPCPQQKRIFEKEINVYILRSKKLLWYLNYEHYLKEKELHIQEFVERLRQDQSLDEQQRQDKTTNFQELLGGQKEFQIPDYLCCRITLDLMEDPVSDDTGHTYEREVLEEHIRNNGRTDPFTRQPISGKLYPNQAIKQAIEQFLNENPWAFEHLSNETKEDIEF